MLKTMILHTLFAALGIGWRCLRRGGGLRGYTRKPHEALAQVFLPQNTRASLDLIGTARFFSVRRETSGNLPGKEDGHEDAAATPMRSGGNTLHRGSACGPDPGKRHEIWL